MPYEVTKRGKRCYKVMNLYTKKKYSNRCQSKRMAHRQLAALYAAAVASKHKRGK